MIAIREARSTNCNVRLLTVCFVCLLVHRSVLHASAAEWFAAPEGKPTASGRLNSPWDVDSALKGKQNIAPGDTLWLRAGAYKHAGQNGNMGFEIRLAGKPDAPIHVRSYQSERATIDGGLNVQPPSTFLWIWDLEILVSEPRPAGPVPPDPSYKNVNRPWGGLNIYAGAGCKFINLIIHDNTQGVSWWSGSKDSELYGCIIFNNGWQGTDRGHGHAIYTQNKDGQKRIADCIFTGGFGYSLHAYGSSRADVDNYLVEGNICFDSGTFLIGGGKPSHHIRVFTNSLHNVSMQLGYSAPENEDCEVRGNVIANGKLTIKGFKQVVKEENLILSRDEQRPKGIRIIVRRNQYDSQRAQIAIFNWDNKPFVETDLGDFLKPGDSYRLLHPTNFFDAPVFSGKYEGSSLRIPSTGEFVAFVLMKNK